MARAAGQLRAGLAYTWAHPDLMLAMVLAFVVGTFGFNYQVTIALMSREVFDLGAEAFGLLSTCFAVGSLSGALLSTRRSVRPRQLFLVVSVVVFGLFTVAAGLMPGFLTFAVDAGAHRGCGAGVQRGQQQLRPARRGSADAWSRHGALLHVLPGRHPRRRAADRPHLRAFRCPVGTHPRRGGVHRRRGGRGDLPEPGTAGAARRPARPAARPAADRGAAAGGGDAATAGGRGGGGRARPGAAESGRPTPPREYRFCAVARHREAA